MSRDAVTHESRFRDQLRESMSSGEILDWTERWEEHPERIFEVRVGVEVWLGLKTTSDYVVEEGIPGMFCSRIAWFNLVGPLLSSRVSELGVRVRARMATSTRRREVFAAFGRMTEIVHPYPKMETPGRETGTPPEGWFVTEERAAFLGTGERHLRAFTAEILAARWPADREIVAFDPACSTGEFLSTFARAIPGRVRTIGQDLREEIVAYARPKLDRVAVGDALRPAVRPGSVNVLFARFLNSEVVTSAEAANA